MAHDEDQEVGTPREQVEEAHVEAVEEADHDHTLTTPVGSFEHGPASTPDPTEGKSEDELRRMAHEGLGGAKVRQKLGASAASAREPLAQRPAEERDHLDPLLGRTVQEGDTLPGERSVDNDEPAFQITRTHVPGTPLPQTSEDAGRSEEVAKLAAAHAEAQETREQFQTDVALELGDAQARKLATPQTATPEQVYATKGNIVRDPEYDSDDQYPSGKPVV